MVCFVDSLRACALHASFRDYLHAVRYPTCVDCKVSSGILDVKFDGDDASMRKNSPAAAHEVNLVTRVQ